MAFDVTPTSGAGPYTFTAQIANAMNVDGERYIASLRSSSAVGSCPPIGTTTNQAQGLQALLNTGVYVLNTSVGTGSCLTFTLQITDSILGSVISTENVEISNI